MQIRVAGTAALCLILATAACSNSRPSNQQSSVKAADKRKAAPDFTLKDAQGQTVKLSDYKGKVVLLNFWATWCGPCKIEIPWFMDFEQKYKDRGFAVIGVSMDDDGWESVKPFIEMKKVNYRMLVGNDKVSQDYGGVESLPTSFLIDREGHIAQVHIGLVGRGDYQTEIDELLDAK